MARNRHGAARGRTRQTSIAFNLTDRTPPAGAHAAIQTHMAQKRVVKKIATGSGRAHPHEPDAAGDVGSGKAIVAAQAMVIAVEDGFLPAALLAPTEILAAQHYANLQRAIRRWPTASCPVQVHDKGEGVRPPRLATGHANIAVGTLRADRGRRRVLARASPSTSSTTSACCSGGALQQKGVSPDVLVMTTTPIPLHAGAHHLRRPDVSVIDELAGRKPIRTFHKARRTDRTRLQLREARGGQVQAYIVYRTSMNPKRSR